MSTERHHRFSTVIRVYLTSLPHSISSGFHTCTCGFLTNHEYFCHSDICFIILESLGKFVTLPKLTKFNQTLPNFDLGIVAIQNLIKSVIIGVGKSRNPELVV